MKAQKDGRPPGGQNIDEFFSSALGKLRKQPSPAVWENITGKLHPSKISPGGLTSGINKWFYIGLAGVAITAAVLFFKSRQSETRKSTATPTLLPASSDSINSPVNEDVRAIKNALNLISESAPTQSSKEKTDQSNELSNILSQQRSLLDENSNNQIEIQNDNLKQSSERSGNIPESILTSKTSDQGVAESTMTTKSSDITIPESTIILKSSNAEKGEPTASSYDSLLNPHVSNENPGESGTTVLASQKEDAMKVILPPQTPDSPIVAKATPLAYSLELYVEPILTSQLLKARSSDAEALLDYRKRNENSFSGTNWGMEGRVSRKNLFIQTGIRYSVFGANADYPFSTTLLDSSRSYFEVNIQNKWEYNTIWVWTQNSGVIYYVPAQDSNLIQQIDSTWKILIDTSYNERNEKSQLRFHYFEIPLLIGYQFGKGKLETEFSGGVALGFLSETKGNIIANDLIAAIPANRQNIPFNKPLLSLLLRIGCSYHLNENLSIFTMPAFRFTPRSAFGTGYPLYQRHYSFGLQFGIKYTF